MRQPETRPHARSRGEQGRTSRKVVRAGGFFLGCLRTPTRSARGLDLPALGEAQNLHTLHFRFLACELPHASHHSTTLRLTLDTRCLDTRMCASAPHAHDSHSAHAQTTLHRLLQAHGCATQRATATARHAAAKAGASRAAPSRICAPATAAAATTVSGAASGSTRGGRWSPGGHRTDRGGTCSSARRGRAHTSAPRRRVHAHPQGRTPSCSGWS